MSSLYLDLNVNKPIKTVQKLVIRIICHIKIAECYFIINFLRQLLEFFIMSIFQRYVILCLFMGKCLLFVQLFF